MTEPAIRIALRIDEAMLADSFLRRFADSNDLVPTEAELQALVNLGIVLQDALQKELLSANYGELLEQAERDIFEKEEWAE